MISKHRRVFFRASLVGIVLAGSACSAPVPTEDEGTQTQALASDKCRTGSHHEPSSDDESFTGLVFGPETLTIDRNGHATGTFDFRVPPGLSAPYSLLVERADAHPELRSKHSPSDKVKVWLNGRRLTERELSKRSRSSMSLPISLAEENQLKIQLTGSPATVVRLRVLGACRGESCVELLGQVSKTIGSGGGVLDAAGFQLEVGAAALATPTALTLTVREDGQFPAIEVEPSVIFTQPVFVRLPPGLVTPDRSVVAYSFAETTGYDATFVRPDTLAQRAFFARDHFSVVHLTPTENFPPGMPLPPSVSQKLNEMVNKELFGSKNPAPSGPPSPCPCNALAVDPPSIPPPPGWVSARPHQQVFEPGESDQLFVTCAGLDVTTSQLLPNPWDALLFGVATSDTNYTSSDPSIASVTQTGGVYANSPGGTAIGVENTIVTPTDTGFQVCTARGGAAVTVQCGTGSEFCGGQCVDDVCQGGEVFNSATCRCECPSGTTSCGGQCVSTACSAGRAFDASSCRCECQAGTVECGGNCLSDSCAGGKTFDQSSCDCQCPAGQVECNGGCVSDVCAAGEVFDPNACACMSTGIAVIEATYGSVCGVGAGNVTGSVASRCNGLTSCSVFVDNSVFGDPSYGCAKNFYVTWTCGADPAARSASHDAVAGEGYSTQILCP